MSQDPSHSLPDISVVVCCHNHDKWIERCIRSLAHQEDIPHASYEVIVVNDGSTDSTGAVLGNLEFLPQLKVVQNEGNIGLPSSLNRALRQALGRYVVRVDSDDYVARRFLSLLKLFLDMNRHYQAVAVDYVKVDEFENMIERVNCTEHPIACGVMFRKECLFDIGLYDDNFKMREGHELRRRFEQRFRIARLEFPLYKYRHHGSNRTANAEELALYDEKLTRQP
jgi:glycosyltransferase involved in cell wall biosynthesis